MHTPKPPKSTVIHTDAGPAIAVCPKTATRKFRIAIHDGETECIAVDLTPEETAKLANALLEHLNQHLKDAQRI